MPCERLGQCKDHSRLISRQRLYTNAQWTCGDINGFGHLRLQIGICTAINETVCNSNVFINLHRRPLPNG